MPLTFVQNPSFAGLTEASIRDNQQLTMAAFNKPIWSEVMYQQADKFWLSSWLKTICQEGDAIGDDTWNWVEDGKWYAKQTIQAAVAGANADQFVITLNETDQYFVPTDIVMFGLANASKNGMNVHGRVSAVGLNGANQTITVDLHGIVGGSIVAGDFTAGMEVQCMGNSQVEAFEVPDGRIHSPEQYTNQLTKMSTSYSYTDDGSNRVIWFKAPNSGRFYWVDYEEAETMAQHKMKEDSICLWGQDHTLTDGTYNGVAGKGMMQFISEGSMIRTFAAGAGVVESDLIEFVMELSTYSKTSSWTLICGHIFAQNLATSLDRYYTAGAVNYGSFSKNTGKQYLGKGRTVGIDVASYNFQGRTVNMMEYKGFSDPDFLPTGGIDYTNFALLIGDAERNCTLKFKKDRKSGLKVSDFVSFRHGHSMNSKSRTFSNNRAIDETVYTSHMGVEMRGLQEHGMLYGV